MLLSLKGSNDFVLVYILCNTMLARENAFSRQYPFSMLYNKIKSNNLNKEQISYHFPQPLISSITEQCTKY